jgi:hypothetical protein
VRRNEDLFGIEQFNPLCKFPPQNAKSPEPLPIYGWFEASGEGGSDLLHHNWGRVKYVNWQT